MFPSNPRQNVLERLGSKKNVKKNLSATSKRTLSYRKPNSPHRLPRLETPPSSPEKYDGNHDLRRGSQEVMPPVLSSVQNHPTLDHMVVGDETLGVGDRQDYKTGFYSQIPSNMYGQPVMVTTQPHPMYQMPMVPVYYAPHYHQDGVRHPLWPYQVGLDNKQRNMKGASLMRPSPLTRNDAANIIQKNFRHWQSRKAQRNLLYQCMRDYLFSNTFVENLIKAFLEEDIIPDLLLEVLTHKTTFGPRDPCYRVSEDVCTDILDEEVMTLIEQTASSVFFTVTKSRPTVLNFPTLKLCDDIIHEVVDSECRFIVRLKVKEMVAENRVITGGRGWLDDFILATIQPLLQIVILEAIDEYQYGTIVSSLVTEVTDAMATTATIGVWQEEHRDHYRSIHKEMISRYAQQHLLDALCLDHMLTNLTGDNLPFYFKNYTDQVLDGMIAGTLINQYLAVDDAREETKSNIVIRKHQEDIFTDLALDVLLAELGAHLDEDSRDLLEVEQGEHSVSINEFSSI